MRGGKRRSPLCRGGAVIAVIAEGNRDDKTILGKVRLDVGEGWGFVMDGASTSFKLEAE